MIDRECEACIKCCCSGCCCCRFKQNPSFRYEERGDNHKKVLVPKVARKQINTIILSIPFDGGMVANTHTHTHTLSLSLSQ
jgi:hypothetical protein